MHAPYSQPVIRLRKDRWDRHMNAKELRTHPDRAKVLGMSRQAVYRIESGETKPGTAFIAAVLDVFSDLRFEDVFEIKRVA
jgi:DNA-binding XRE family transcriptional regulator